MLSSPFREVEARSIVPGQEISFPSVSGRLVVAETRVGLEQVKILGHDPASLAQRRQSISRNHDSIVRVFPQTFEGVRIRRALIRRLTLLDDGLWGVRHHEDVSQDDPNPPPLLHLHLDDVDWYFEFTAPFDVGPYDDGEIPGPGPLPVRERIVDELD